MPSALRRWWRALRNDGAPDRRGRTPLDPRSGAAKSGPSPVAELGDLVPKQPAVSDEPQHIEPGGDRDSSHIDRDTAGGAPVGVDETVGERAPRRSIMAPKRINELRLAVAEHDDDAADDNDAIRDAENPQTTTNATSSQGELAPTDTAPPDATRTQPDELTIARLLAKLARLTAEERQAGILANRAKSAGDLTRAEEFTALGAAAAHQLVSVRAAAHEAFSAYQTNDPVRDAALHHRASQYGIQLAQ